MTNTTVPSIYKNSFFKRTGTGILPYVNCGTYSVQTLTWEDLTDMLFLARDDTDFQAAYLLYLNAIIAGTDSSAYLIAINAILASYASQIVSCSAFKYLQYTLLDNASSMVASSDASTDALYGRTTIIVTQQNVDTVPCATNYSASENVLYYFAAAAVGSYETNSEYPAHILRIKASYTTPIPTPI
jgi:hypothetical protein